jgi:hypothetical protein
MKNLIFYLTFIIITTTAFSNSLDDKKNQISQIENEIKRKGEEIKKKHSKNQDHR